MKRLRFFSRGVDWLTVHLSHRQLMYLLGLVTGITSGIAAVILKNTVHLTRQFVIRQQDLSDINLMFFIFPVAGIILTVWFVKTFIRDEMGHGITKILHAISKAGGYLRPHNCYSSIVTSTLTVGTGGSVGLESPIVVTGSSIGSNLARIFRMNYKSVMTLIGCGAAGAIAGIFKAPVAAVIFGLEVLMLDISMWSIIPLLIAAVSGATVSYLFLGREATLHYPMQGDFSLIDLPWYGVLGVLGGLVSVYFTKSTLFIESLYGRISKGWIRIITGGGVLGLLILIFPPLFGEGYDVMNSLLDGRMEVVTGGSLVYLYRDNLGLLLTFLVAILLVKPVAMTSTTGAGGVGGIFAPTIFMGGITGYITARLFNLTGLISIPERNFILAGMAGLMAGVMHAPLTAIFLIAEVTGGYSLFVPLMIAATLSYITAKYFEPHSIYTHRLAKKGELITHNKDKAVLTLIEMERIIEKDFLTVSPDDSLGKLVKTISRSRRNLFPVISGGRMLAGIVLLDDIRHVMFNTSLYDRVFVRDLMQPPPVHLSPGESMESVVRKFEENEAWNLPVINNGEYIGFLSRSRMFSFYRNWLIEISDE